MLYSGNGNPNKGGPTHQELAAMTGETPVAAVARSPESKLAEIERSQDDVLAFVQSVNPQFCGRKGS
ncbi:hypothetical protein MESS2_1030141 [Mesorhizobium metallidurans STM 2683]|uniref:Uncharacterized protein n=1 Tax=Mesorhizobium metallidurans STM 2683 TaxID=1297569 RepID=M5EF34_9HYPH|nr:hypothetical protein MESS2_1030141 [Mesorhizobium metallidurans STM 2683]